MPPCRSHCACSPDVYRLVTPLDHRANLSSREERRRNVEKETAVPLGTYREPETALCKEPHLTAVAEKLASKIEPNATRRL